jgi:diadenosine tetraphosphate (Ap4A) HIT family hydrolase
MIWSDLLCGFGSSATAASPIKNDKLTKDCVFCNPTPERFDIILQDDRFVVFKDRSPASLHHLLAIPRQHVPNIQTLQGPQGAALGESIVR